MNPGDVALIPLPTSAGPLKLRPAVVISVLPGKYGDILVAGISTQVGQGVSGWDEVIHRGDVGFPTSGLRSPSLVRLSFLHAEDTAQVQSVIGQIDPARLERLQTRLADHLRT